MFGKLKKAVKGVKKVVNKSPVHRATAKAVGKTGGPAGKAISKAMTGGASRKTAAPAGGRGPQTLGTGAKIGMSTGGNASKTRVPGVSMSTPSPKTRMKTPSTVGSPSFNKTAGNSLMQMGRRSKMARR